MDTSIFLMKVLPPLGLAAATASSVRVAGGA